MPIAASRRGSETRAAIFRERFKKAGASTSMGAASANAPAKQCLSATRFMLHSQPVDELLRVAKKWGALGVAGCVGYMVGCAIGYVAVALIVVLVVVF